jgi:hypothetical protein
MSCVRPQRVRRRVHGRIWFGTLTASVVLFATAAAANAGVLDQSQPVFLAATGGVATATCQSLAQTFTSGMTGELDQVDLGLWRDPSNVSGPLIVEIQTVSGGVPSGTVLTSESIAAASITTAPFHVGFISVPLNPTVAVTGGVQYAIVLSGCGEGVGYFWWRPGDLYPNGTGSALNNGTWCSVGCLADGAVDFTFQTYVASPTHQCHAVKHDKCSPH